MMLTYCPKTGFMLASIKNKTWLDSLTHSDANDLMYDNDNGNSRMTYDRRRSMALISNREWADGVQWK